MSRRTLAVLILAAWVAALGWLTERHYLGGRSTEGASQWPVPPGAAFQAMHLGARQYGLGSLTIDTLPEGYRVVELITVDLPDVSSSGLRRTSSRVEAMYTRGLQLTRWRSDLLTERGRVASIGSVSGDSLLTIINQASGETPETLTVQLRRPIALPGAISLIAASRGLPKPGDKLNLEIYDPLDHELRTERLVVAAESIFTVPDSEAETERRWRETTPQWPIMHAVLDGISRDQMMARHKSNHIQVVYAPNAKEAHRAARIKAAAMAELGLEVHLCGSVKLT